MSTAAQLDFISEQEYLAGEQISELKYEYIDGYVYAMSGASNNHNLIAGNVFATLANHLKKKPCRPYISDMKVKIGSRYFYPDVLVDCSNLTGDSYYTEQPIILVEVLSKSTRRMDETTKRMTYMQIPSLQEYILIEQDFVDVEIIRRETGWLSEHYFLGDELTLSSIGLTLTVEDIYERVQNNDVKEWLESQQQNLDR
ncbi:MAG TPA: Uma2 family endonuclease [Agitococcus sp.]|nr:Uma2 family endonuclease [Agitococcus sp.]HNC02183.1 Uma2 family endonuclease [Agitococcus sp.]